ncbi:hypothetical protein BCR42DRAFT_63558 [Absidia repens]|uniref:Uncharacterized protein n=1 Tax=Absidia repens TaxID=90262 RepID=A0A1X2ID24_9FUNG|nr:hypothetical protein BCR42DRAFT_63558 [Absidia repens]
MKPLYAHGYPRLLYPPGGDKRCPNTVARMMMISLVPLVLLVIGGLCLLINLLFLLSKIAIKMEPILTFILILRHRNVLRRDYRLLNSPLFFFNFVASSYSEKIPILHL